MPGKQAGLAALFEAVMCWRSGDLTHRTDPERLPAELRPLARALEETMARLARRLEELTAKAAEFEAVMDTVPAAVWVAHDPEVRRLTGSRWAAQKLRLPPGDNQSLTADDPDRPRHFQLWRDGRPLAPHEAPLQRAARGEEVREEEVRVVFADGSYHDEMISALPLRDALGRIRGAVGAAVDITARKRAERAWREGEQRFRDFAASASDWLWETDEHHRFVWMSPNVEQLAGIPRQWHYGKTRDELMAPYVDGATLRMHKAILSRREPFRELEYVRRGPGGDAWLSTSGVPVFDEAGHFRGYRGVSRDITARKRAEEEIRKLAHEDSLTGLPNRALLQSLLAQALASATRAGQGVGLVLIDLDDFRDVNDTCGHTTGDVLLQIVAARLSGVMRPNDTLARLGGDEFAAVLTGPGARDAAHSVAQRLIGSLAQPIWLDGEEVCISGTAGIAHFPDHADEAETLVRLADVALYQAKREGRGRARLFDPAMEREIALRNRLKGELRRALERDEFTLLYQPQIDCRTEKVVGLEALIRWRHPELGLLAPADFIGIAEATGLIRPLGLWVLRSACSLARSWRERGRPIRVCVNLSAAQLRDQDFAEAAIATLDEMGLPAADLELEITESLLVERADEATEANLRQLVAQGVRLALDDFGTGYSAMAQLTRLPVATIKIDRSLLVGLEQGEQDIALVRAIVMLGHMLDKRVLAEGVETPQQLAVLRELGCDGAQGFLFGGPVGGDDLWATLDG